MVHINEVIPIVVDPSHERFAQIGEMTFSGSMGDGTCIIKFEDGTEAPLNDGWLTGLPQFVAPLKEHEAGVRRLSGVLPELRPALQELYTQVVEPRKRPPTAATAAAHAGFVALVNKIIFETDLKQA